MIDYGEEFINPDAVQNFMNQLEYPLYFMDFETWITAVPEQDGHWSYRQIPFQFSLHKQESPDSALEHFEYLAENTESTIEDFAEVLLKNIGEAGSILVYNQTFEKMILNQIKDDFEHHVEPIEAIKSRIIDLMVLFRTNYRLPEMMNSYSIKAVLPALAP